MSVSPLGLTATWDKSKPPTRYNTLHTNACCKSLVRMVTILSIISMKTGPLNFLLDLSSLTDGILAGQGMDGSTFVSEGVLASH